MPTVSSAPSRTPYLNAVIILFLPSKAGKSSSIFRTRRKPRSIFSHPHCLHVLMRRHQVEAACKCAGAAVLKRMPTYVETVVPLKAKLKGLEIDMHGCAMCCRRCRCRTSWLPLQLSDQSAVKLLAAEQQATSRASCKSRLCRQAPTARC